MRCQEQGLNQLASCDTLLLESCTVYSEINTLYQKLESNIFASAKHIVDTISELNSMQQRARTIDESIKQSLADDKNIAKKTIDLVKKREALLQTSIALNSVISHKASAVKAHLQHEVGSINTNRHAINGYKSPEVKSRSRFNKAF